jgi:16S rRNA (cytosine967-C5)-methyltransferase
MRPGARIAALIEVTHEIEEGIRTAGAPADVLVSNYFRARRYAGSKDRRAITQFVYDMLRQRELVLWILKFTNSTGTPRAMVLCYLTLFGADQLAFFGEEGGYGPETLSASEAQLVEGIAAVDLDTAPEHVSCNLPEWALAGFEERFGDDWLVAAKSLNQQAPVDLRLNTIKTQDRVPFLADLEGFEPTPLSPIGVRSAKNIALGGIQPYKQGKLEVQDEAAQVACLLVGAKPGMQVADMCAGAGGKSLTVAGAMQNKGQIHAFDISGKRLDGLKKRIQRAGARNIQVTKLSLAVESRSEALQGLEGRCDRVLVDVPCSGTGTWRRSPDQRWRQDEKALNDLNQSQQSLLTEASRLVKADGRLYYMTCSVLPQENEAIVSAFLKANSDWSLQDYRELWQAEIGEDAPETDASLPKCLQLTPASHQTDGFFVAVLGRLAA